MRRTVALILRVSLTLTLAGGVVALSPSPCLACACVPTTPARTLKQADAAFVGTVVAERPLDDTHTVQTFAVKEVYRGPLPETIDVVAGIGLGGGSDCGLLYPVGVESAVVADLVDGTYRSDACRFMTVAQLSGAGGTPSPPIPAASSTPSRTADVVAPASPAPPASGLRWPAVLAGAFAGVVAIGVTSVLVGRRDRRANAALATRSSGEEPEVEPSTPPDGSR